MHIFLVCGDGAWAQNGSDTGQITGVVKDPDQAPIAGAQVILTNGRQLRLSDADGAYTFPALRPGDYTVRVNASAFNATTSPVLKVVAGQTTRFDAVALARRSCVVGHCLGRQF